MFTLKNDHLVKVGLKDLIRLLRSGIPQNPNLVHAALVFWDPAFNCFHFNYGMMAPTVFDVTHLLRLVPYGLMFDITAISSIPFTFPNLTPGKTFLKYINAILSTPKNITPKGSETFSDDGFGDIKPSDGEKEVEQPMPVAAIPLQTVPPHTTFRRKKHTRTLGSISKEPSKILSSPKRRKALIVDFDEDTVSYLGTARVTRSRQAIKE
ncbi:hypothetical protein RHMOL_Rhmol01G0086600 [Rhododendron molle]|uniref:Uncharacterized protein n=1 Tax=Rhododendron molle TaxID=49168 RepID=A0ACC0PZZ1_RHOML|nr:hypothetical protein RHMOL_Rhmol01G0086600 [Rhododendron molle]